MTDSNGVSEIKKFIDEMDSNGFVICQQDVDMNSLKIEVNKSKLSNPGREVSQGRTHYELKKSSFMKTPPVIATTALFKPYCEEYFGPRYPFIEISTVQVVDSYPGSESQCFHSDNSQKGNDNHIYTYIFEKNIHSI